MEMFPVQIYTQQNKLFISKSRELLWSLCTTANSKNKCNLRIGGKKWKSRKGSCNVLSGPTYAWKSKRTSKHLYRSKRSANRGTKSRPSANEGQFSPIQWSSVWRFISSSSVETRLEGWGEPQISSSVPAVIISEVTRRSSERVPEYCVLSEELNATQNCPKYVGRSSCKET